MTSTMKNIIVPALGLLLVFAAACNKYQPVNGKVLLSGQVLLTDPTKATLPTPLTDKTVYLNECKDGKCDDTATYLFQVKTDAAGRFNIPLLKKGRDYIVFTKYNVNTIEYYGAVRVKIGAEESKSIVLNVSPKYTNGLSLTFVDVFGGPVPKIPFRIYTNETMAVPDSQAYAYINDKTDENGQYNKYNLPAGTYYIVSKNKIGTADFNAFKKITVDAAGVKKDTVTLHP
jgi:hypothetical protein